MLAVNAKFYTMIMIINNALLGANKSEGQFLSLTACLIRYDNDNSGDNVDIILLYNESSIIDQ